MLLADSQYNLIELCGLVLLPGLFSFIGVKVALASLSAKLESLSKMLDAVADGKTEHMGEVKTKLEEHGRRLAEHGERIRNVELACPRVKNSEEEC